MAFEDLFNLKEPQKKLIKNLFILALVGAILILSGNIITHKPTSSKVNIESQVKKSETIPLTESEYRREIQERLEVLLSKVNGAGRVAVEVSLEGGHRYNFAVNRTQDDTLTQEKDASGGTRAVTGNRITETVVTVRGSSGEEPLILEVKAPVIKGILVVAEGAGSSQVKARLSEAVRIFLDIPAYKVTVIEGRFK